MTNLKKKKKKYRHCRQLRFFAKTLFSNPGRRLVPHVRRDRLFVLGQPDFVPCQTGVRTDHQFLRGTGQQQHYSPDH